MFEWTWPETRSGEAGRGFVQRLPSSDKKKITCHQLKNSPSVSWNRGQHPIAKDFSYQVQLSKHEGFNSVSTVLVVSNPRKAQILKKRIPGTHKGFTDVRWFPWEDSVPRLCASHKETLEPIAWLSKHEDPSSAELMEVLGVMLGAWMCAEPNGTKASDVIDNARKFSPTLLRPQISDDDALASLQDEFATILASFENFSYSMVRGFFRWEIRHVNGATTRSTYRDDCLSSSFADLQRRVIAHKPATVDQLEEELR